MLNGINVNSEDLTNTQLNGLSGVVTNPINNPYKNNDKNLLIDETAISNEAINLYQKEQDVKKFSMLALSNPEDLSHEQIIEGLFNKGVSDPLSEDSAGDLASDSKLLKDLGF